MHELSKQVDALSDFASEDAQFRVTQLKAAEHRSLLIVRALSYCYASVAAFVLTTLIALAGAILSTATPDHPATRISYALGLLAGCCGVAGLVAGALLLVRETRESFTVLSEENRIITNRLRLRSADSKASF